MCEGEHSKWKKEPKPLDRRANERFDFIQTHVTHEFCVGFFFVALFEFNESKAP